MIYRPADPWCVECGADLGDHATVAYGDCVVCEYFVCESCDAGYDSDTGHSVCPRHAGHPAAAGFHP